MKESTAKHKRSYMLTEEKRKLWLKDKSREYHHGWKECEKGNPHKQLMYPEQHDQYEYTEGYSDCFDIQWNSLSVL